MISTSFVVNPASISVKMICPFAMKISLLMTMSFLKAFLIPALSQIIHGQQVALGQAVHQQPHPAREKALGEFVGALGILV